ncbi:sugar phosphate isomerase/epimerase [Candidatus Poribacteria bacterium]|nr:sugar phosphate isomerase/epimerase [Candidatus Poribacteria bacterium]
MREPIHAYMKVGLIHFMAFPETIKGEGPIAETVKKIAEDEFFTAIEITWMKDPEVRKQVREMIETSGMTVGYGAQPAVLTIPLNPNSLDEEERRKAVEVLKGQIDMAYEMGAKRMAFLSGKDPGDEQRDAAVEALVKTTQELCDYAAEKGMGITLETFDREVDKKALIGPSELAAEFARRVNRANFGLMVDLSHMPLLNETPTESVWLVKDYLVHAHVGNCVLDPNHPAYGDQHPRFGIGENDVEDVAEYLDALLDVGFLNTDDPPIVSFEVKPMEGEDPDLVIANAKRVLIQAWAMI